MKQAGSRPDDGLRRGRSREGRRGGGVDPLGPACFDREPRVVTDPAAAERHRILGVFHPAGGPLGRHDAGVKASSRM